MPTVPFIKHLKPVEHANAQGGQKEILDQAFKQVGFIPNMYKNMANAPGLLSTYLHGYNLFRSESGLSPAEQEIVFLAISQFNECHYCVAAHSMIAEKTSGVPAEVLKAIRAHQPIPDKKQAVLFDTVVEMVKSRGRPESQAVQKFLEVGYQERDLLYIVLAIAVKTLSNYSNHAFSTPLDDVFAGYKVT